METNKNQGGNNHNKRALTTKITQMSHTKLKTIISCKCQLYYYQQKKGRYSN